MRHLLATSLTICACALAQPAAAQVEGPPVPVDKAAYHVPVFRNEYIAVVNVYIPPGRAAGYHIHSLDQISVVVEDADNAGNVLGEPPYAPRRTPRGNVGFTAFSKKPMTHRVNNAGPTPFHNIVTTILYPEPGRFTPGSRADVPGYAQLVDNERVRIWRLVLEPGQSAAAITQRAPGLRVVVDGGEIVESVPGQADRGMMLKLGEFYWQEPGMTRTVSNIGTTRINLVEFELK
jgi:hypothetical protein